MHISNIIDACVGFCGIHYYGIAVLQVLIIDTDTTSMRVLCSFHCLHLYRTLCAYCVGTICTEAVPGMAVTESGRGGELSLHNQSAGGWQVG